MQIANVRVAGETRKSLQIATDEKECGERQELLAAEARASWQRMETILAKWSLADRNNDALELNALLVEQKSTLHDSLIT
jgi:Sperm tail